MRIHIVDSNYLQDPLLEQFLSASRSNAIALIDLTSIEMHKANAEVVARRSTEIAHRYPSQVLVLRPTASLYTMRIYSAARARRLIDASQSRSFAKYGAALQAGEASAIAHRATWVAEAETVMDRMRSDSAGIPQAFKKLALRFSRDELRAIRLREPPFSREVQFRLLGMVDEITIELLHNVGVDQRYWPINGKAARNTIIYRYALSMVLLYTRWVHFGQQVRQGVDKIVNDVVDMHLAAISTFFGGALTKDRNLLSVQQELRFILRGLRGYVG